MSPTDPIRPVILLSVDPVGDGVLPNVVGGLGAPDHVQAISSPELDAATIRLAFTKALNHRNPEDSAKPIFWRSVRVFICGALSHPDSLERVRTAAKVVQDEFRHSAPDGRLGLVYIVSPTEPDIDPPSKTDYCALMAVCEQFDFCVFLANTNTLGRRADVADLSELTTLGMQYLIGCNELDSLLASNRRGDEPLHERFFSFGLFRLDISEQRLREGLKHHLWIRLFDSLFDEEPTNSFLFEPDNSTEKRLNKCWKEHAQLPPIREGLREASQRAAKNWEHAKSRLSISQKKSQLLGLLPRPCGLGRLLRFFWPFGRAAKWDELERDKYHDKLIELENLRFDIVALQWGFEPDERWRRSLHTVPFNLGLQDVPELRADLTAQLPSVDGLMQSLVRRVALSQLLKMPANNVRTLVAELLDEAVPDQRLVWIDDFKSALEPLADRLATFFLGQGLDVHRFLFTPPGLPVSLPGFNTCSGRDQEFVVFELTEGVNLGYRKGGCDDGE